MSQTQETVHTHDSSMGGIGFLFGVILLLAGIFLFFYYGLPAIQNAGSSNPTIQVPETVDVNVQQK